MLTHFNENFFKTFSKQIKIFGIWLMVIGTFGILFPMGMSLMTDFLIASILLLVGVSLAFFTAKTHQKAWLEWFKSFLLIAIALIMLLYPSIGIQTLGLLFALYFLTDAFMMLILTFKLYPTKNWFIWLMNGLLSLLLGGIFLFEYPFEAPYLVGLFIAISLLFNGLGMIITSNLINKLEE